MIKTLCLASLLLLGGCAPLKLYTAPAQGPRAQIISQLYTPNSYSNLLSVSVSTDTGCRLGRQAGQGKEAQLFSVYNAKSRPEDYQPIAANTPLYLVMAGTANASRVCELEFITTFAAGARYRLEGGIVDNPAEHAGLCRLNVINADSGESLVHLETPLQTLPRPDAPFIHERFSDDGCHVPATDKDRQP